MCCTKYYLTSAFASHIPALAFTGGGSKKSGFSIIKVPLLLFYVYTKNPVTTWYLRHNAKRLFAKRLHNVGPKPCYRISCFCGTSVFSQGSVPYCGGRHIPCPCQDSDFTDINPFWYTFTCFTSGTLGFVITPNNSTEDYDWQLFDITGHNPADVYTDPSLFVACDWSGEVGNTGASASGTSVIECDNLGIPLFSSMPALIKGHNYILLVSHFTISQSGYALSFGGGTAVITDTTQPHLQKAIAKCSNLQVGIKLNKAMQCSSLAADGSDFSITPAVVSITAATSAECTTGFDVDSVVLTLDKPLPVGNYTVTVMNGSDGNTLLDNCSTPMASGENVSFTAFPVHSTPMDSLTAFGCAPGVLQLVFKDGILCNTIAPDGSDFVIIGNPPVTINAASGICDADGLTHIINVQLSAPIQQQGSYQIKLVNGDDGNTLINECGQPTPLGSSIGFTTKDTVSAAFTFNTNLSCKEDVVSYFHDGRNGVNFWQWSFDSTQTSSLQTPVIQYNSFGAKQVSLIVSNGVCSDTAFGSVFLDNELKASFEGTSLVCPGDIATFKNNSIGNIISWNWDFGNGSFSTLQTPPSQTYTASGVEAEVPVELVVQNNLGCRDSTSQFIKVVNNCYIAVPSAFTPNNDGLNDYLYPLNAYKAANLTFRVYNRYGQEVFETTNWTNKWDGTFKGQPANAGTYVWLLQYTDTDTGKQVFLKGSTILIR